MSRKNFYSNYLNFIFWYFFVFVLSATFLSLATAIVASRHFSQQIDKKIEIETNQLLVDYNQDGLEELWNDVKERVQLNLPNRLLYSIILESGEREFDRIKVSDPAPGWHELKEPIELKVFVTELKNGHRLLVASPLEDMRSLEKNIASNFMIVLFLIIVLGIFGGVILSSRYVKRLTEIQNVTKKIGEGNFESRIPTSGTDDVFDDMAKIFNSMLDRIQILVNEIQRVSSNVAHEMRTPLGHVKQKLEKILSQNNLSQENRATIEEAMDELDQTLNMFSATMRLSEINSGIRKSYFSKLNLSLLVSQICELYESTVQDEGRTLKWEITPNLETVGDASLLKQLVVNIIENFIQHTTAGTELKVSMNIVDGVATLSFKDNGLGIDDLRDSLQAFHSRPSSKGVGLGLSLIQAIASLHDYTLEYQNRDGFGIILKITK